MPLLKYCTIFEYFLNSHKIALLGAIHIHSRIPTTFCSKHFIISHENFIPFLEKIMVKNRRRGKMGKVKGVTKTASENGWKNEWDG
jgi:hypothetical protein